MKTRLALFGCVAVVLMLATPGAAQVPVGIDADDPVEPPVEAAQTEESDVDVRDNSFEPEELRTELGADGSVTVRWAQTGDNPHTVTADDDSFDSHANCPPACMRNGETFEHRFTTAGTVPYYCKIHGGPGGSAMSGVIIISEAPASAAEAQDTTTTTVAAPATTAGATRPVPQPTADAEPLPRTGFGGLLAPAALLLVGALLGARLLRR